MSKYETLAGHVTRGETFSKLLYHLDELTDQAAVMAHLHNTEDSAKDAALSNGWRAIVAAMQLMRRTIINLSKGSVQ